MPARPPIDIDTLNRRGVGHLPGHMGLRFTEVTPEYLRAEFDVQPHHMAPNGYLHAASVIALADTTAGYACVTQLPAGAQGFTTLELKCNFLGTALEGTVCCEARPVHLGRNSQVWDVTVHAKGQTRTMALFRCTQMILWPKAPPAPAADAADPAAA